MADHSVPNYAKPRDSAAHHVTVESLHKPAEGFEKHVAPATVPLPEKGFMSAQKGKVELPHLHAPAESFHKPAPAHVTVPAPEANFMKARSDAAHHADVAALHAPAPESHKHVQPPTKADPVKHYMT